MLLINVFKSIKHYTLLQKYTTKIHKSIYGHKYMRLRSKKKRVRWLTWLSKKEQQSPSPESQMISTLGNR